MGLGKWKENILNTFDHGHTKHKIHNHEKSPFFYSMDTGVIMAGYFHHAVRGISDKNCHVRRFSWRSICLYLCDGCSYSYILS